jgi:hypothetical protein
MSGRVYLLGVGLALVAGALAFTDWALSLQPGVTEANVRRIRPGMTRVQVEALLGPPSTPWWLGVWELSPDNEPRRLPFLVWEREEGSVSALFELDGRLRSITPWRPPSTARRGLLARLRAWLGW